VLEIAPLSITYDVIACQSSTGKAKKEWKAKQDRKEKGKQGKNDKGKERA
jgi:hypothetical protein